MKTLPHLQQNFTLHPLIHTFALAKNVLHVGTGRKRRECGLNYIKFQQTGVLFRSYCLGSPRPNPEIARNSGRLMPPTRFK
jgi:hypothetical protein